MLAAALGAALAAPCQSAGSFERWLDGVRQEASTQGLSSSTLTALNGLAFDPGVVRRDRGQGVFQQSFLQFSDRMVAAYRLQQGAAMIRRHADLFARIAGVLGKSDDEAQYRKFSQRVREALQRRPQDHHRGDRRTTTTT